MDAAPRDRGVNLAPLLGSSSAEMITDLEDPWARPAASAARARRRARTTGSVPTPDGVAASRQVTDSPELLGRSATRELVVSEADTAIAVGSGSLPVLGTPVLLAWCEAATCAALDLPGGQTSVGTRVALEHLAASPVGASV